MSTRTTLRPHVVLQAGDMSGNLISDVTILQSLTEISYTAYWSGTSPVGTLSVQVCNDCQTYTNGGVVPNTGHWVAVALEDDTGAITTTIPVSGNTGSKFINVVGMAGYAARLIYTFGSGVGSLNAVICGKVS